MLPRNGSGGPCPTTSSLEAAQGRLDTWYARHGDARARSTPAG
jgi:hypothetical protein